MARDTLILVVVVAAVTALATALGAANLGTALAFGTMAFVVTLMGLMLKR